MSVNTPTSDGSWSPNLRVIGDLERRDHYHLTEQDKCYFFGEYTAGGGWKHSETNQLVLNLKKSPDRSGTSQWKYKTQAIQRVGAAIAANLKPGALTKTVFVPIPPSKLIGSAGYDDRMAKVARSIGPNADVRPVLYTATEREALHTTQTTRDRAALRATLAINRGLLGQDPEQVVLLDDMLTTGCSFKVCKEMLGEVWPNSDITGIFVARRIIPCLFDIVDI